MLQFCKFLCNSRIAFGDNGVNDTVVAKIGNFIGNNLREFEAIFEKALTRHVSRGLGEVAENFISGSL
jgi:hypothetical protein